jgi:AraC-like DNA-binding protein
MRRPAPHRAGRRGRDGDQSQYAGAPPQGVCGTLAHKDQDRPLSLETLAEHAHVSVRTFTVRFRHEVGTSLRAG